MGILLAGAVGGNNAYAQNASVSGSDMARVISTVMTPVENNLTKPLITKAETDASKSNYRGATGMMWSVASIARSDGNAGEYRKAEMMYRLLIRLDRQTQSAQGAETGYAYNPRLNAQTNYYDARMRAQQWQQRQRQADWQQRQADLQQQQAAQERYMQQQQYMQQQYAQERYRYAQQQLQMQRTEMYANMGLRALWYYSVLRR